MMLSALTPELHYEAVSFRGNNVVGDFEDAASLGEWLARSDSPEMLFVSALTDDGELYDSWTGDEVLTLIAATAGYPKAVWPESYVEEWSCEGCMRYAHVVMPTGAHDGRMTLQESRDRMDEEMLRQCGWVANPRPQGRPYECPNCAAERLRMEHRDLRAVEDEALEHDWNRRSIRVFGRQLTLGRARWQPRASR